MLKPAPVNPRAPVEGMAWLSEWEQPFEGGYSLLWKCAWANAAGGADLCHAVFGRKLASANNVGRHSRSLLDMGWVDPSTPGIAYLRDRAIQGSLVSHASQWTPYIAADSALRYCQTCMEQGYQSALFQIDGLGTCPIHGLPLQTACSQCGAAGQRYAITDAGFAAPFHCATCQAPLAGTFNPDSWGDAAFGRAAYTALAPIAAWLHELSGTSLKWNGWEEWHSPLRWHCTEEARRVAALEVLVRTFPSPWALAGLQARPEAPQLYDGAFTMPPAGRSNMLGKCAASEVHSADRFSLYKAVRRHVTGRLHGCTRVATPPLSTVITTSSTDGAMQLSVRDCPRAQALALWRYHFETPQVNPHVLVLRPAALEWPNGAEVDAAAWTGYLLASFHAAMAAFDAWLTQAVQLIDADLLGIDRPRARALYTQYAPLLSPTTWPTFSAVSMLTLTDAQARQRLIVVGPADLAAAFPLAVADKKMWCSCRSRWGRGRGCQCNIAIDAVPVPVSSPTAHAPTDTVDLRYVVPMIQLKLPPNLDGSQSKAARDARGCWLHAENDLEAIALWLAGHANPATRRKYTIQIEKALIWCVAQRRKALSEMTVDDVNDFVVFVADPLPHEVWLPSQASHVARHWSPFRKVSTAQARDYTLSILSMLLQHWANQGYVTGNPFLHSTWSVPIARKRTVPGTANRARVAQVTVIEWEYLQRAVGLFEHNTSIGIILAFVSSGCKLIHSSD